MAQVFSVLSTSGWQGDSWKFRGEFERHAEAVAFAATLKRPDGRDDGYIVAVIGNTQSCDRHGYDCVTGDTSRVPVREPHLKGRRAHITIEPVAEAAGQ